MSQKTKSGIGFAYITLLTWETSWARRIGWCQNIGCINLGQQVVAQWIHASKGIMGARYTHNVTFGGIEAHAPCITPHLQCRQVLLQQDSRTWSALEHMGRYTRQSSANSRTCESTHWVGRFYGARTTVDPGLSLGALPSPTSLTSTACHPPLHAILCSSKMLLSN